MRGKRLKRTAPACPFYTGCTNCPVFLCSKRPTSPVQRDEETDQTCFPPDSRKPVELRLQEDVCSFSECAVAFTISNRLSGCRQVSPSEVKLQNTLMASRWQPWFGSIQYSPERITGYRKTDQADGKILFLFHLIMQRWVWLRYLFLHKDVDNTWLIQKSIKTHPNWFQFMKKPNWF